MSEGASGLNLQYMQFDQYLLQLVRGFRKGSFIVHSHRDYGTANQLQQRSFADSAPSKGGRTPATSGLREVIMIDGLLWEQRSSILTVYQWLMCLEPESADPGDLERTDGGSMPEKQPASGLDPDQAPSSRTPDLWMLKWLQTHRQRLLDSMQNVVPIILDYLVSKGKIDPLRDVYQEIMSDGTVPVQKARKLLDWLATQPPSVTWTFQHAIRQDRLRTEAVYGYVVSDKEMRELVELAERLPLADKLRLTSCHSVLKAHEQLQKFYRSNDR